MNRRPVARSGTALAAALVAALAAQSSHPVSPSPQSGGTPSDPSGGRKTIHCNSLRPFASTLGQTPKPATAITITLNREGLGPGDRAQHVQPKNNQVQACIAQRRCWSLLIALRFARKPHRCGLQTKSTQFCSTPLCDVTLTASRRSLASSTPRRPARPSPTPMDFKLVASSKPVTKPVTDKDSRVFRPSRHKTCSQSQPQAQVHCLAADAIAFSNTSLDTRHTCCTGSTLPATSKLQLPGGSS